MSKFTKVKSYVLSPANENLESAAAAVKAGASESVVIFSF